MCCNQIILYYTKMKATVISNHLVERCQLESARVIFKVADSNVNLNFRNTEASSLTMVINLV